MKQLHPLTRSAGIAGILAAIGLAVEFSLFMASGWTPDTFANPSSALAFLESDGTTLRAAAFVGVLNLAFALFLLVGLSATVREEAPARSAAILYGGLVGLGAHALVPAGLWLAPSTFSALAATHPSGAQAAWGGFAAFLDAAGGLGYLFAGIAYAAAAWAMLSSNRFSSGPGWIGLLAGGASALTFLAAETTLAWVAAAAFLPALVATILFRAWAGVVLLRIPAGSGG